MPLFWRVIKVFTEVNLDFIEIKEDYYVVKEYVVRFSLIKNSMGSFLFLFFTLDGRENRSKEFENKEGAYNWLKTIGYEV